ncbi:rac GTPase-activating protein 1-like isoform X2 [Varroa destructor]|uniref:Rac GTPase-activating protein 1 n=1 Tax=Varroa destructor TaxID=109461 RepID=A0A7M7JDE9_VARDE|nr:rac GTPase-activating protein 1-like isoform X2 [Varroa destructor]
MTRRATAIEAVENLNKRLERAEQLYRQFRAFAKRHRILLQRYHNMKSKEECYQLQAQVIKLRTALETEIQEHRKTKLCVERLNKQFQSVKEVFLALDVEDEHKWDLINTICSNRPHQANISSKATFHDLLDTPMHELEENSAVSMESLISMIESSSKSSFIAPEETVRSDHENEYNCDQESVYSNDTTESATSSDEVAPFGQKAHGLTSSYQEGFSNNEEETLFRKIRQRSSSIDASLKVSVDRNTRITTAEARIGTKPGLVVSVETPTGRRSQSFDTRMEGEANNPCVLALLADKAVRTPTDLPNAPMYRSDSASKLTNKKHQFVRKYVGPLVKCAKCKRVMKFHDTLQCTECSLPVHQKCQEDAPLPCMPTATIKSNKSMKEPNKLLEYCPVSGPRVPPLLINCFHELEKDHRIREVGLYRNSALQSDVQSLVKKLLKSPQHDLSQYDTHVIAGVVKSFLLKLLSEPLVPTSMYSSFAKATEPERHGHSDKALRSEVEGLPQANRDTLAYVMLHIRVVEEISDNKMDRENLTRVFAPTIVGYPLNAQINPALMDQNVTQRIMSRLLNMEPPFWDAIIQRANRMMLRVPSKECVPNPKKSNVFSSPKIS